MISQLSGRQKWLFIIACSGIGLLLLDRVVFTPLTNLWQAHATEINALQKSVANGSSLIDRAAQLHATWNELQARTLPKEPAQSEQDLISAFDRWGHASGVELGSIKPQWKRGGTDRYSLLECRVDATGTFTTLARFLYEVERAPLALRLESVELSSREDTGQKITLALVVTGLRLSPLEGKP